MLPHLAPMLAVPSAPFDSDAHCFEVKWDGVRALAAVEDHGWHLWGRAQADYTARYPELEILRALPAGTLLDGELVAVSAGLPDLGRLLRRHGLVDPWKIAQARHWCAVQYVVFDLLYDRGWSLLPPRCPRRRRSSPRPPGTPGLIFRQAAPRRPGRYAADNNFAITPSCPNATTAV